MSAQAHSEPRCVQLASFVHLGSLNVVQCDPPLANLLCDFSATGYLMHYVLLKAKGNLLTVDQKCTLWCQKWKIRHETYTRTYKWFCCLDLSYRIHAFFS